MTMRARLLFWAVSLALHGVLLVLAGHFTLSLFREAPSTRQMDVFLPPDVKRGLPEAPKAEKKAEQPPPGRPADLRKDAGAPEQKLRAPALPAGLGAGPMLAVPGEAPRGDRGGGLFGNRFGAARGLARERFGGDRATEDALQSALEWLARNQERDGRWLPNPGPVRSDQINPVSPALTGLAALAFLTGGHTQDKGAYAKTVDAALTYLLNCQAEDGCLFPYRDSSGAHTMYSHALAALALAEAYNVTKDKRLIEPVRRAAAFTVKAQQADGGWDYVEATTGRNDASVTCWALMSLAAGHYAGATVPEGTWVRAALFLERISGTDSMAYTIKEGKLSDESPRRTSLLAAGLFCKRILGWDSSCRFVRAAAAKLAAQPPSAEHLGKKAPETIEDFPYAYWYYGALAMFQVGGASWDRWNAAMKQALTATQARQGVNAGSWLPVGRGARVGGRTYATALCALSLGVYYRYLPINELQTRLAPAACAAALRRKDGQVRKDVAAVMLSFGKESLPSLAGVMDEIDDRKLLQGIVAHILAYADRPQEVIAGCMARQEGRVNEDLLTGLMTLGEAAVEGVLAVWPKLEEGDRLKTAAVRFLAGYTRRKDVQEALNDALTSKNEFVRLHAASALAGEDNTDARATLTGLLASENPFIRLQVIAATPEQRTPWSVEALVKGLEDPETGVRRAAYEKLVRIVGAFQYDAEASEEGRKAAIARLRDALRSEADGARRDPGATRTP